MTAHPIDLLLEEIARWDVVEAGATDASRGRTASALERAGGQDLVNITAAFVNVLREQGTVLGPVPPELLTDVWTLAVCHRWALSLKVAFTSRDPSEESWRRFVRAWERGHLQLSGYFQDHPHAFAAGDVSAE